MSNIVIPRPWDLKLRLREIVNCNSTDDTFEDDFRRVLDDCTENEDVAFDFTRSELAAHLRSTYSVTDMVSAEYDVENETVSLQWKE